MSEKDKQKIKECLKEYNKNRYQNMSEGKENRKNT